MQNAFREKSVIVTGASSGIGKALALRLADEGAWLALAARNAQRLEDLAEACQTRGGKAVAIPTDVADESLCYALIQRTREVYGRIDMLVNNAGIDVVSTLESLPDLIIGYNAGYRCSGPSGRGKVPKSLLDYNDYAWSGDHCMDPEVVPGILFSNKAITKENPSLLDIPVTVLAEFGVEKPEQMIGSDIFGD